MVVANNEEGDVGGGKDGLGSTVPDSLTKMVAESMEK